MIVGPRAIDLVGGAPVMPGLFDDSNMQTIQALNTELHRVRRRSSAFSSSTWKKRPDPALYGEPALAPSAVRSRLTETFRRP